jgi:hypothetical protein
MKPLYEQDYLLGHANVIDVSAIVFALSIVASVMLVFGSTDDGDTRDTEALPSERSTSWRSLPATWRCSFTW